MNKKLIVIIILIIILGGYWYLSKGENGSELNQDLCGNRICDEGEDFELCPSDCKEIPERETCGPDNGGYCIDFREECELGYQGIGPDKCRRGRSAECCVPK